MGPKKQQKKKNNRLFNRLQNERDKCDAISQLKITKYSNQSYFNCKHCKSFLPFSASSELLKVYRAHTRECNKWFLFSNVSNENIKNDAVNNEIVIDNDAVNNENLENSNNGIVIDNNAVWKITVDDIINDDNINDDNSWEDYNNEEDNNNINREDLNNDDNNPIQKEQLTPSDSVLNYQEKIEKLLYKHENKDPFLVYKTLFWEDLVDLCEIGELLLISNGKLRTYNFFLLLLVLSFKLFNTHL
jgi:hypothetical protein